MTVTDVSGVGKAAVFLIKGEANILFEAGMAYAADLMIENIRRELGDGQVDAVLISHSIMIMWPVFRPCARPGRELRYTAQSAQGKYC